METYLFETLLQLDVAELEQFVLFAQLVGLLLGGLQLQLQIRDPLIEFITFVAVGMLSSEQEAETLNYGADIVCVLCGNSPPNFPVLIWYNV